MLQPIFPPFYLESHVKFKTFSATVVARYKEVKQLVIGLKAADIMYFAGKTHGISVVVSVNQHCVTTLPTTTAHQPSSRLQHPNNRHTFPMKTTRCFHHFTGFPSCSLDCVTREKRLHSMNGKNHQCTI